MAKKWKVVTLETLRSELKELGYKTYLTDDLEINGKFFVIPKDGVYLDLVNDALLWMSTKDPSLGRLINKELKKLGYKTNIVVSRKYYLVVYICVDFEKYGF